ncbi:MAG: GNAT family N-acetyltransferase [Chloroflexota bacterium]
MKRRAEEFEKLLSEVYLEPEKSDGATTLLTDAEYILQNNMDYIPEALWEQYLNLTRKPEFLKKLHSPESRERWAESAFRIIKKTNYTLLKMLRQRALETPDRTLFKDMSKGAAQDWSYRKVNLYVREIAATLYQTAAFVKEEPRVAIFSENSLDSACCDLACLCYDIFDTPLNVSFTEDILIYIIDYLKINIVIVDSEDRLKKIELARGRVQSPFAVITLFRSSVGDTIFLQDLVNQLSSSELESVISSRRRKDAREVATVMWTSGSTGAPKGVSFSIYNLVSKRFARGAALPEVGTDETLLCFLPLYHTFGRYLEMLGMIYWGGTYTFLGNTSSESLFHKFLAVQPTGFISVPLRWIQIYERAFELSEETSNSPSEFVRNIVGNSLRWGLSAAGYLDPKIFRFFQNSGIELCSGFGMTEATGGVTMTPPGKYLDNAVGAALPGIKLKQNETGELFIRGEYIARYVEEAPPGSQIPFPEDDPDFWLPTGDIFRVIRPGYYEIVDRVKDIYKNNRGQTIAPRNVESRFDGVPGIKRTFLVGDGKPYNILFIVPDESDEIFTKYPEHVRNDYFNRIIAEVNSGLAPYERIINFKFLHRDFQLEKGELTAKGSFNRKNIEQNFQMQIDSLYLVDNVVIPFAHFDLVIPRWFFRDLGITEMDVVREGDYLVNKRNGFMLLIKDEDDLGVQIGNLIYKYTARTINLGTLARSPYLWSGNPALQLFSPCKEGWDVELRGISCNAFLSDNIYRLESPFEIEIKGIKNEELKRVNRLFISAIYGEKNLALAALRELDEIMPKSETRITTLIQYRLETLARHYEEDVRCEAYKILLLNSIGLDLNTSFLAFINSGYTFLNDRTITDIANSNLNMTELESLRRRLLRYREELHWPAQRETIEQFANIFSLLTNLVHYNKKFYPTVRAELTNWILLNKDIEISKLAQERFDDIAEYYETELSKTMKKYPIDYWASKLVFDDGLREGEIERLERVLINTTFLKQSIMLAFDEDDFCLEDVPNEGIWITRINSAQYPGSYRISINTHAGKHYRLQAVISEDLRSAAVLESIYWLIAITGFPVGNAVMPRLGCARLDLEARSSVYNDELSVWEKIRLLSNTRELGKPFTKYSLFRKWFIGSFITIFTAWRNSGKRIVPGLVSPNNVIVPELDFKEGAMIISLAGWKKYYGTSSLIKPLIHSFYKKTMALYSWTKNQLDLRWIFDATLEALGKDEGILWLEQLRNDLTIEDVKMGDVSLLDALNHYTEKNRNYFYLPLPLLNAIEKYDEWMSLNTNATQHAREEAVQEIYRLYSLNRYPEIIRYHLFRNTYFENASEEIKSRFEALLQTMSLRPNETATHLIELSELQTAIDTPFDKEVFSRMAFPSHPAAQEITLVPGRELQDIKVHSTIVDEDGCEYVFREPESPSEIGRLFKIFFSQNFPRALAENDKFYIVVDGSEKVVGGLCYRYLNDKISFIDGCVVVTSLQGRGIGSLAVEEFSRRMQELGFKYIKTHFYLQGFYLKLGFKIDERWGNLVKALEA